MSLSYALCHCEERSDVAIHKPIASKSKKWTATHTLAVTYINIFFNLMTPGFAPAVVNATFKNLYKGEIV